MLHPNSREYLTMPKNGSMPKVTGDASASRDPLFCMWHKHIHRTYIPDGVYFVTTYIHHRILYFHNPDLAKICEANMWNVFQIQECVVFAYVVMPDHLHLLVQPTAKNISECMRSIKTNASRDINRYVRLHRSHNRGPGTPVMAVFVMEHFLWQSSFYDHVIRDDRDFRAHVEYIHYNPVKAGLVRQPEAYPFLFINHEATNHLLGGG